MNFCPRCGAPIQPTDKFCGSCAAPIPRSAPEATPGAPPGSITAGGAFAHAPAGPGGEAAQAPSYVSPMAQSAAVVAVPPGASDASATVAEMPAFPASPLASPGQPGSAPGSPPQPAAPYGPPPAPPQAAPPPTVARCDFGHEVPAGQSHCAAGHPIALGDMKFAGGDAFVATAFAANGGAGGLSPTGAMSPFPASQAALGLATTGAAFGTATVGAGMQASGQGASGAAADAAASGAAVHPALRGLPAPPPGPWAPPGAPPHSPPPTAGAQAWAPSSAQPTHQPPTDATGATSLEEAPSRRALRGFLYSFHGDPNGAFWPLFAGRNVIGRGGSGEVLDIEIHDPTTSSRHGVIAFDTATGVCYEDAGSTNGSFVNDQPVGYRGSVELHDGDRIRFGGFNAAVKFVSR